MNFHVMLSSAKHLVYAGTIDLLHRSRVNKMLRAAQRDSF